eukprot:CFRG7355T1
MFSITTALVTMALIALSNHVYAKPGMSPITSPTNSGDGILLRMDKGKSSKGFLTRMEGKLQNTLHSSQINTGDEVMVAVHGLDVDNVEEMLADEDVYDAEYIQTYSSVKAFNSRNVHPAWHMDRINQRTSNLDGDETIPIENPGAGIAVYIMDSGIDITHAAFGGRATHFYNVYESMESDLQLGPEDLHGHGTHVAGLVGASEFGPAVSATIRSVKVLNNEGYGSTLTIVAGLTKILNHVQQSEDNSNGINNHIVVMSLSGPTSLIIDSIIEQLYIANVLVVVAAGNKGSDACTYTPSRNPAAITVGAMSILDEFSSYSNYGNCVDITAPGSNIISTFPDQSVGIYSGTSMSAPLVAGVAALLWGQDNSLTAIQIRGDILLGSTENALSELITGTPDRILYSHPAHLTGTDSTYSPMYDGDNDDSDSQYGTDRNYYGDGTSN